MAVLSVTHATLYHLLCCLFKKSRLKFSSVQLLLARCGYEFYCNVLVFSKLKVKTLSSGKAGQPIPLINDYYTVFPSLHFQRTKSRLRGSARRLFSAFYALVFNITMLFFGLDTKKPSRLRKRKNSSPYSMLSVVPSNFFISMPLRFPC